MRGRSGSILAGLQALSNEAGLIEWAVSVDSTINRAHQHARVEAKSSDEHLTWADVTVRRLWHDAQRRRLVGELTAGSL